MFGKGRRWEEDRELLLKLLEYWEDVIFWERFIILLLINLISF